MDTVARFRGCLLGLATGDALGTTVEFQEPGTFEPILGITGAGVFQLEPGEWTDDTSMALCLAESLVECRGFDLSDQLERYLRWYKTGYMSINGSCFDIGNTVRTALDRFERTHKVYSVPSEMAAGNGSLMRLCPVPLCWSENPERAIEYSGDPRAQLTEHKQQPMLAAILRRCWLERCKESTRIRFSRRLTHRSPAIGTGIPWSGRSTKSPTVRSRNENLQLLNLPGTS